MTEYYDMNSSFLRRIRRTVFKFLNIIGTLLLLLYVGGIIFVFTIIIALIPARIAHWTSIKVFILFWHRMQWFGHACIVITSNDKGDISFFASLVFVGNLFLFGSIACMRSISSVKLLSDH